MADQREIVSRWHRGPRGFLPKANESVDAINALRASPIGPRMPAMDARAFPVRMRILSLSFDYLVCETWDGTVPGLLTFKVAKPYKLRHDVDHYGTIDGLTTVDTGTVTASLTGGSTETWKVTPDYEVENEIYAIHVIGGTGVNAGLGEWVEWIDTNLDGRQWGVG